MASRPVPVDQAAPRPDVSVVSRSFNEAASVEELTGGRSPRSTGRDYELIFVDDGSTDGSFEPLERFHAADPRVRGVRLKRNFGQHPAMHAGLARARGEIVVTMDSDLQNPPEDLPKLIEAVEAGYDVASGRRAARRDSWGRTLPSRLINGMLRRFTGVRISDFGCAFNAYRRDAVEPVLGAIGKQKFTKALVLSTGAASSRWTSATPRAPTSRAIRRSASSARRCTCSPGSGRSRSSGSGSRSGRSARSFALALGVWGIVYWIDHSNFPGPLFGGVAILFVLGVQGFILALVGEYLGTDPARRPGRPLYTIDREN